MSILDSLGIKNQNVGKAFGVAAGIITNNKDPEKLGRVKMKFPWMSDKNETDWVRVTALMTGKEMGSFFLPEVGDEVLVAFEHGDINYPFVIGSLWNGKAKPPEVNSDGKNNIRKIKSRSGHEIVFDDNAEEKKEKLDIHTNAGHTIVLDDTSSKEKIEIQTKAGHKIVLDDSSGKEKIEINDKTGSNKMVIDSVKNSVDIESAGQLNIKASMITIEATGQMTVKSSAILTIQGSLVKIN